MKKIIAVLLCVALLLGLCACAAKQEQAEEKVESQKTDTSETTKTDAPEETSSEEREHVVLKFYTRVKEQDDQQRVFDKLNEYLEEKLNTSVEWHFLGGEFNDKIAAIINTGEEFDACYTASIANYYIPNVAKGALVDLTDMLKDHPDLYNSMPESFWDATRVEGRIYAVPNQQIAARQIAFQIPTEFLEGTGYTIQDLEATGGSIGDLSEFIQAVYDKYGVPALGVIPTAPDTYCGYEMLGNTKSGLGIKYGDETGTVVNVYASEEFRQLCEDIHELASKGLLINDTPDDVDYSNSRTMSKNASVYYTGTKKPGGDAEVSTKYGIDMSLGGYGTPYLTTSGITATMWGISTTSKYPERALEVLELLDTDEYAMNLLAYGIEGIHWEFSDDSKTTIRLLGNGYQHGSSWALGNVFLTYPTEGQPVDVWQQTFDLNNNAERSPLLGFSYTSENVETEISDMSNAVSAAVGLFSGTVDVDQGIKELLERMDAAGFETMRADAQAQVDAFLGK